VGVSRGCPKFSCSMYRLVTKHTESQLCAPLRVVGVALFYLVTPCTSPLADFGRGISCSDVSIHRFFKILATPIINTRLHRNLQPHRAVLPAIAWHLVNVSCDVLLNKY